MLNRRQFTKHTASTLIAAAIAGTVRANHAPLPNSSWYMPEEGHPHTRTWMGFGANASIWGKKNVPQVRQNLARIAQTIARYEPVTMLVRPSEMALCQSIVGPQVDYIETELDDLWLRDTGPTFVINQQGKKAAIDFNFNGWGHKQTHTQDALVAQKIAQWAGVPSRHTPLVLEGGSFEVDGHGTAMLTESCVLNQNRNPGMSKAQFEDYLMPLLGLEKIIWLPGVKGKDITDGHTDFYARFVNDREIIAAYEPDPSSFDHAITLQHLAILRNATNTRGKHYQVHVLEAPSTLRASYANDDFAAGYIGYYLCNGAVIMQGFGDAQADQQAKQTLQKAYPNRVVEQIAVDAIAAGGGSIHCTTQQEPKA